jgi:hypothetical protein
MAEVLLEDKGCVGDGIDFSQGLPERWTSNAGMYGSHGPFELQVYGDGVEGQLLVVASAQAQIKRSEAVQALSARIEAKDHAPNNLLLITCALPDDRGFACGLDTFMYLHLANAAATGTLGLRPPKRLSAVVLHRWNSADWIELYRADDAVLPWSAP